MSAIRAENGGAPEPARLRLGWAMALGATCVLVIGIVWLRPPPAPNRIAIESTSAPAQQVLKVSLNAAQVDRWVETSEAPLENETKLVLDDAKTAMNTLAKSFLPGELLTSASQRAAH
jgi:hypothetical protein